MTDLDEDTQRTIDKCNRFVERNRERASRPPIINLESLDSVFNEVLDVCSGLNVYELQLVSIRLDEVIKDAKARSMRDKMLEGLPMSGLLNKFIGGNKDAK